MDKTIKLTYDSMIALIQGKKLHVTDGENTFIFLPPGDGIFITHDELYQLRYNDSMGALAAIKGMQEHLQRVGAEKVMQHPPKDT